MDDYELFSLLAAADEIQRRRSTGKVYMIKEETVRKLNEISGAVQSESSTFTEKFDPVYNCYDLQLTAYVLDSVLDNFQAIFMLPDVVVIDCLDDGRVCVEMKINNACYEIGKEE